MSTRELKPVREKPEYFDAIEVKILEIFRREIYLPILEELGVRQKVLLNSYEDLIQAIASGQIQYVNGHFEGSFNSTLSKELRRIGAQWDRKHGWWTIPRSALTNDMRSAIGTAHSRFQRMAEKVDKKLESLVPAEIAGKVKLEKLFDSSLYKINRDIEATLQSLTIEAKLTADQRKRIATEYTENVQLYIRDFAEKEILELRKKVQANAFGGVRYETMIDTIRDSYGVSQNKAKFLARQETSLMMTKFKQTRYEEAGVNEYRWQTVAGSAAHPVRPMHKRLDGKIFAWDNPPIVDKNGNRKNPGQDYNCRCVAIPIVKF